MVSIELVNTVIERSIEDLKTILTDSNYKDFSEFVIRFDSEGNGSIVVEYNPSRYTSNNIEEVTRSYKQKEYVNMF